MTSAKAVKDTPSTPPSAGFLKRVENAAVDKLADMLGMPKKPKAERTRKLTEEEEKQLRHIELDAIAGFDGDLTQLEAALGMLRIGHQYGWKVLYIIHSKKTVRTYEDILGIRIRELFAETGPSSYRSVGFNLAQRFSNFWKVAGGTIKIPRRHDSTS
jgi:hypothetical protein